MRAWLAIVTALLGLAGIIAAPAAQDADAPADAPTAQDAAAPAAAPAAPEAERTEAAAAPSAQDEDALAAPEARHAEQASAPADVWLVDLDGAVGPASADLIIRAIDNAGAADAEALVLRMDTPGGLDKSMRSLVKAILAAELPVVTYVAPDGARAASAGTYIAYASHIAAMAPATNIGSSTPVSMGGPPPEPKAPAAPQPEKESQGESGEASDEAPDEESDEAPATEGERPDDPSDEPSGKKRDWLPSTDAMTRKVVNDAVAYLQSLAELRGRNLEWAEETVREGANLRASAALEKNVIDLIARSLDALLQALDGREVEIGGQTRRLRTAGSRLVPVETDWRHELLSIITDPSIAYGLLIIGMYGLILEFYNPGTFLPAVTGIICLLLGAYGLQMLPINYAGLALIIVGFVLIMAEVMTPTYGVLGVGGVAAFIIGSIMLIDSDLPGYQLPWGIIAGFAATTGGIALFVAGAALQARRRKVVTGAQAMIGADAWALEGFQGQGAVRACGEIWQARSAAPLEKGAELRVADVQGLLLVVEPRPPAP